MKADDRKKLSELERMMEDIAEYAKLYEKTENWSIEDEEGNTNMGPVNTDIAEYVLEPEDHFFSTWSDVSKRMRNYSWKNPMREKYRSLERKILDEHSEFIKEVYGIDEPLGRKKIEGREI